MFDKYIKLDIRRHRATATVTQESLTKRFKILLPRWLIQNKSILDLGSALGAAGHWSLSHGATHYTGVEIQKSFCEKSNLLLSQDWNTSQYQIFESSLDAFVQSTEQKWDIVLAAGVIHGFFDPYSVIKKIGDLSNHYVVVETLNVPEPTGLPTIHICRANMVKDHEAGRPYQGYASIPGPKALDIIMNESGFARDGDYLYPEKIQQGHDAFNDIMQYPDLPAGALRFGARYKKTSMPRQSLEYSIVNDTIHHQAQPAIYEQVPSTKTQSWQFDDSVAQRFQQEAKTNIPDYERVIDLCLAVAKQKFSTRSAVVDVGSALGHTLDKFVDNGYTNVRGIESSPSMINRSSHADLVILSETWPKDLVADLVLANWTLHFVQERKNYIKDIYDSLSLGGVLILTEKTAQVDTVKELYYNFKRNQGVSDDYIKQKEIMLRGYMHSFSTEWYFETLKDTGYKNIQILNASMSFVTFYAEK